MSWSRKRKSFSLQKPVLFVSDVHLSAATPETSSRFFEFLRSIAPKAGALYVLGDLFDYWIGDDDRSNPLHTATLRALAELAASGVAVSFMHGNRDFLVGRDAARDANMALLADPTGIDLFGRKTLLMHGDTLCTDDAGYQAYRRLIRNRAVTASLRRLPITARHRIAHRLRAKSETGKRTKPMAIMDVNQAAVARVLRGSGATLLIHGHTHRANRHPVEIDGSACERIVLPDWHERGGYLRCTEEGCDLILGS